MGVIARSFPPHLYPVEYFVLLHGAYPLPPAKLGGILAHFDKFGHCRSQITILRDELSHVDLWEGRIGRKHNVLFRGQKPVVSPEAVIMSARA